MPKKLKQNILSNFRLFAGSKKLVPLAATLLFAASFFVAPKVFAAVNIPVNNVFIKTDIEVSGGKLDNLVRVVKGQNANFTVDITVVSAKDASGADISEITFKTDKLDFTGTDTGRRPILNFGAGLDSYGNGNTCTLRAISDGVTPFLSNSTSYLNCDFSKGSNKIGGNSLKVGQTYKLTFSISSSDFAKFNINPNSTTGATPSIAVYPFLDIDVALVIFPLDIAFSKASKQVYFQFFNTQAELDAAAASNTRPPGVEPYGGITGNAGAAPAADPVVSLINRIVLIIAGIINQFIYFIFYWLIAPLIQAMLSIHTYQDSFVSVIYAGWEIVRNICNILFIVAIIAMGMGTLLRFESYQWRHLLVQLVIAALLVNFSLVIGQTILAFADTIQNQFLPNNVDVIRSLARDLMVSNTSNALGQSINSTGSFASTIQYLFWVSLAIGSFLVFAAMAVFLVVRVVALWVLLMLSPIAYVARILPTTKGLSGTWWSNFLKYAFFTPVLAFFLNMAAVISNNARNSPVLQQITTATFSDSAFPKLSEFVFTVASNIILLVFLLLAIRVASQFGVVGGDVLKDIGEKGVKLPFTWTGGKIKAGGDRAKEAAQVARLNTANKFFKPKESDGMIKGFLKEKAYNIASGGAVTAAKKKSRADDLHEAQHTTEAFSKAYSQQARGQKMDAVKKFELEHLNTEVKKVKDLYSDADTDELVSAMKDAVNEKNDHKRAINFEAIMSTALKEGSEGEVLKELKKQKFLTEADPQELLNKANLHEFEGKRVAGIINRESRSKGKYQNLVKYEHSPGTSMATIQTERQKALDNLKIEDLSNVHESLYLENTAPTGSPPVMKATQSVKRLLAAMKDEPTAKDLLKKMKKAQVDELKTVMATFSATPKVDLGLTPVEYVAVTTNMSSVT